MEFAGWVAAGVSIVGAIASLIAAIFGGRYARTQAIAARQQADISQKQLELAERTRRDQAQPYVFVDIRPDEQAPFMMMLIVENTGPTVAHDVRVSFDPPLQSASFPEVAHLDVLRNGITALPPGRRIRWDFDSALKIFEPDSGVPMKYRATVEAKGPFGPIEPLVYEIDFAMLRDSEARSQGSIKDIAEQLKATNKTLKGIADSLEQKPC